MSVHVGAYPTYGAPDTPEAVAVVEGLAESPLVAGLEVPYLDGVALPTARVPADWHHVVTLIPATMAELAAHATYGLASPEAEGRAAALAFVRSVREVVARRRDIRAVEVHSAPTERASATAFAETLAEVASWDWNGVEIVVEHCDAWTTAHAVQKGFLSHEDELSAIASAQGLGTQVRAGVNWARSVIESRQAATALEHVRAAAADDLLGAVFFSSVADRTSPLGGPWADVHLAPAGTVDAPEGSLLTPQLMAATLAAVSPFNGIVGVKVGLVPADLSAVERVARLLAIADLAAAR